MTASKGVDELNSFADYGNFCLLIKFVFYFIFSHFQLQMMKIFSWMETIISRMVMIICDTFCEFNLIFFKLMCMSLLLWKKWQD